MNPSILAVAGPSPLWYLTRGTGLVALLLLTASVALGVASTGHWAAPSWPRFVTAGLHRSVSLLVVVVLAVHIVTAELDTFAPVGWLAVVVPFASSYRAMWLGLGTVAFDLLVALVVTSLLRGRLGYRTWRAVHWAAYLSWPVALVHALGTGTDARLGWVQLLAVVCVVVVIAAGGWRLAHGWPAGRGRRVASGTAAAVTLVAVAVWAVTGPLRAGWAKRAGTPPTLLATARTPPPSASQATPPTASRPSTPSSGQGALPAPPFSASLSGTVTQSGPNSSGQVVITIATRVSGGATGTLRVVLRGQASGGGVSLESSSVSFGPPGAPSQYQGHVGALNGEQLAASVTANTGGALSLGINLQIDPSSGTVRGTLQGESSTGSSAASVSGDGDGGR